MSRARPKSITDPGMAALKVRQAARSFLADCKRRGAVSAINTSDYRQLMSLADDLQRGDVAGAMRYASRFDTAVRDEIPAAVWRYMGGKTNPPDRE